MAAERNDQPIFLVGCHRSGTTLLRLILDSHPHISFGPEVPFLVEFVDRITGDQHWQNFSRYGFPKEYWLEQVATLFDRVKTDYARTKGKQRWADKAPRYAMPVDLIAAMFPTCQIVHIIRDGRDVIASHRDGWGYVSALKAVAKWPYYVHATQTAGRALPAGRYYEMRYEDLLRNTESEVRSLLDFLGEPWEDAVLHYERQHDTRPVHRGESARHRTTHTDGGVIYRGPSGNGRHGLDPLLSIMAGVAARRRLRELGYIT